MNNALDFRLLGPVEVSAGGRPLPVGGPKQRSILALLLLQAGTPVSRDSLVDAVWGEHPPTTAATALHGYVSQLRKVLEPEREAGSAPSVLVTRGSGYALDVTPDQIDAERFRSLAEEGRRAADADERARLLREALALWRGPALGEAAGEPALASDAARLDEERAAALGDRIEADLELGRHAELVGELEALVADEPLRERPRGQLILALYRCGRQADALAAYRDARRTLVEEVGIEPGPALRDLEHRVLAQDPSLDLQRDAPTAPAPHVAPAPDRPDRRRRLAPRAALLSAAALAGVAALAAVLTSGRDESKAVAVRGNSVAVIDPATNEVTADVPVGGTPTAITAAGHDVWVLNADDQAVSRIDTSTRAIKTLGTGGVPTDIAAGEGALWVANGKRVSAQFVGPTATSVSRIDPGTNAVRATVSLPHPGPNPSNENRDHLAVGRGSVWAVGPDYSVSRIDPRTAEVVGEAGSIQAEAVAAGPEGVWARDGTGNLERLDRRRPRIHIAATGLGGIAVGAGAVWTAAPYDGTVWRVDPDPHLVERSIPVSGGVSAVAVGAGGVWAANALRGTVSRIDPKTNRVTATIDVGGTPRRIAIADGRVWVTVAGATADEAPAAPTGGAKVAGLPASVCGPVFYSGEGEPDALIVSDMPLRGGARLATAQMSDAIAFVLRSRGFRAGDHRIGYQSCDDSTAQTGIFDLDKCASNAKAYAANRLVIGEVGPFNSECALPQLPIAGKAPGGPLAMVSPTASLVGLTRPTPNAPEGVPQSLYPSGKRNFARIYPSDADQGAANALETRHLGARTAVVVSDGGYGEQMAISFNRAARSSGVRVKAWMHWDPEAGGYRELAERVARRRPDAVFVSGLIDSNGGAAVAALRKALGRGVPLLANDGFLPISRLFVAAGPAARGVRVSLPGLTNAGLPPAGRHFVSQFAATQPGGRVQQSAVYAAQATIVMLDAIARSNGSRASVTAELLRRRVNGGFVGSFGFDANGDSTDNPITIVRAEHGGGSNVVASHEGASVERVIRVPRHLGG